MKTAWPLGRVFGIPIRVHVSFFLIVAWVAWMGWDEGGWRSGIWAAILIITLFACVVLHELGHSLVAMAFGAKVRSVTLYPVGGVAGLERIPHRPYQELLMALAGPAVNGLIVLTLTAFRGSFPSWSVESAFPTSLLELRDALIRANVVLALFNLIPAFPMDGGRVLRSLLAVVVPYARATRLAAAVGQALAVGLLLLGFAVESPFLSVIAVFVFVSAGREEAVAQMQGMMKGLRAEDLMTREFVCIRADDPIQLCADIAAAQGQRHFAVQADGRVVGVISADAWIKTIKEKGGSVPAFDVMQKVFVSIDADAPLERLYPDLQSMEQAVFPVVRDGRLIGFLTIEDVMRRVSHFTKASTRPDLVSRGEPLVENPSRFTVDLG